MNPAKVVCLKCGKLGAQSDADKQHCSGWFRALNAEEFEQVDSVESVSELLYVLKAFAKKREVARKRITTRLWNSLNERKRREWRSEYKKRNRKRINAHMIPVLIKNIEYSKIDQNRRKITQKQQLLRRRNFCGG